MLYTLALFGTLTVVEAVESTHKIACDTADTVECHAAVMLGTAAAGTGLADDARVSAAGIAVNGVVDSSVSDT